MGKPRRLHLVPLSPGAVGPYLNESAVLTLRAFKQLLLLPAADVKDAVEEGLLTLGWGYSTGSTDLAFTPCSRRPSSPPKGYSLR